ncbi:hypothetical protein AMTRI_Chr10g2440 [Amborella trichopoda]
MEIGNLTNLEFLEISSNELNGSLPSSIGNLSKLVYLNLYGNHLTSSLPPKLWNLETIQLLDAGSNNFQGNESENSRNCMNMSHLKFLNQANRFSSSIPKNIGQVMPNLQWLNVPNSGITGSIPNFIGDFVNLSVVDLVGNKLMGPIPTMRNLMDLQYLNLSNNTLSGYIPPSLRFSFKLKLLDLGKIPSWIGKSIKSLHLYSLQVLDLTLNSLSSTVPAIFKKITAVVMYDAPVYTLHEKPFETFYSYNQGDLYFGVTCIDFSRNNFSGPVPKELTRLSSLHILNLSHNHLSGRILEEIYKMRKLERLDLPNNLLSGEIPPNMQSMTFLNTLNVSFNNLSRPIPYSGQMTTFNTPSYYGNPQLCGPLLLEKCTREESVSNSSNSRDMRNGSSEIPWMSVGLGFGFGFGGFFSMIFVPRHWSHSVLEWMD